jgi:hypothetical protein
MENDNKDWKIRFSHEALEGVPPEAVAHIATEMQTLLVTGGLEELLAESARVEVIKSAKDPCPHCGGPLTRDPQWHDEWLCLNTPACAEYVYYEEGSEIANRLSEVDRRDEDQTTPDD